MGIFSYFHFIRALCLCGVLQVASLQDASCQTPAPLSRLESGLSALLKEPQYAYAVVGLQVSDANTGKSVFAHNARYGLLPASSQKLLTAAAALELLGPGFRYRTDFGYAGTLSGGVLAGRLVLRGDGDPTLGSMRFGQTSPGAVAAKAREAMARAGISRVTGGITAVMDGYETATIPGGWLWEDIGNYYGAGHGALNWHENQYALWLRPGDAEGRPVTILRTDPLLRGEAFDNELLSGAPGSGDRAVLYFKPGSERLVVRGTVSCCVSEFRIAGAVMDPVRFTLAQWQHITGTEGPLEVTGQPPPSVVALHQFNSPSLDTIIHAFLQKSVNLYGEALVHRLSSLDGGKAVHAAGMEAIRRFWSRQGIAAAALNIVDGSGLSPQNRVTAEALVQALLYARQRPWFPVFLDAMPVHNGMRMKSGSMGGVRSFAGYVKAGDGREYAFAVIVNNYAGSGSAVTRRLEALLGSMR